MNDIKQYPDWQKQIREAQAADLQRQQVTESLNEVEGKDYRQEQASLLKSILSKIGIDVDPTEGECVIGQYKLTLADSRKSYYARPGVFIWVRRDDLPEDDEIDSQFHPKGQRVVIHESVWYNEDKPDWEQVKLEMAKAFDEVDEDAPRYLAHWEARRLASLPYPEWQNKVRDALAKEQEQKRISNAVQALKEREQDLPIMKKLMARAGLEIEASADHKFEKDGYNFSLRVERNGFLFVITHQDLASPYHPVYQERERVIGLSKDYVDEGETAFDPYFASDVAKVLQWIDERRKYIAEAEKKAKNGISKADQLVALLKELLHSDCED